MIMIMNLNEDEPPGLLGSAGRRLWASVVDRYDLAEHERQILYQAAQTSDTITALVTLLDGALVDAEGRIRHEHIELRQQRALLVRLVASLRIPYNDDGQQSKTSPVPRRPQRRGAARGIHLLQDGG